MKKILYIITIPDWGGAQRYIFDLAENLKSDFDVTVAFGKKEKNNDLEDKCANRGIKTYKFKFLVRPINPIKDILAVFELKKYIAETKPDIIHLNSSKSGVLGSMAAAIAKHKPQIIYTVHGWVFLEPMNKLKKWLYIFLERLASRWRDKIIVLGEKEKQAALRLKIAPPEKILVMPHSNLSGVSFLEKNKAKNILGLPPDKKIIGTIANFYPAKGLEYLIEAASNIKNDWIFSVIGDGFLKNKLQMQIKNAGLQNHFILHGEKEFAAQYLNAFDIFVLPSVKEGMPFAILEAMAAKLPIVATNVGSVSEMLSRYPNKIIVPPQDPRALKEALLAIKITKMEYSDNPHDVLKRIKELYNGI